MLNKVGLLVLLGLTCTQTSAQDCQDTNGDLGDSYGDTCAEYVGNEGWCGNYDTAEFVSNDMCCACGGGSTATTPDPVDDGTAGDGTTGDGGAGDVCVDTNIGPNNEVLGDDWGDHCGDYAENPGWCGNYNNDTFNSDEMCCACGGGDRSGTGGGDDGSTGGGDDGNTGGGDDGTGGDGGDGPVEEMVDCPCQCQDAACWQGCWTCLHAIFGATE